MRGRPELQPAKQDTESLWQPGAKKAGSWPSTAPWPPHTIHLQAWTLSCRPRDPAPPPLMKLPAKVHSDKRHLPRAMAGTRRSVSVESGDLLETNNWTGSELKTHHLPKGFPGTTSTFRGAVRQLHSFGPAFQIHGREDLRAQTWTETSRSRWTLPGSSKPPLLPPLFPPHTVQPSTF